MHISSEQPKSVTSELETIETIVEKEKIFEASMDQAQTSMAPADPSASGCESKSEAESENQLWVYVTLQPGRVGRPRKRDYEGTQCR